MLHTLYFFVVDPAGRLPYDLSFVDSDFAL